MIQHGKTPLDPGLALRDNLMAWMNDPPRSAFRATTASNARAWQTRARRRFAECLGDIPPRVPPKSTVLEEVERDGYTRTIVLLDTAPHLKAIAWMCVPHGCPPNSPAMIATPGHSIGAMDLIAMDAQGKPRNEGDGYQKDYALQVVRLGMPVLAVEPLGFGERRDAAMMRGETLEPGCDAAAHIATMLGTTLAAIRINDLCRALDWFARQPQVDPKRIGLMGISGGGQMTLWTAAFEPRFKVAVVSGYMNLFADSVIGLHHCICNFVPGLAKYFDMPDLAAMVAPRPMLIESGTEDYIFPIKAARAAVRRVRDNYEVFDARDRITHDVFEGPHQWSGRRLKTFLRKWL
jgi:dienelactone hydrolase